MEFESDTQSNSKSPINFSISPQKLLLSIFLFQLG